MWAVVSNRTGDIIECFLVRRRPAIFYRKTEAVKERENRYTFKDQMERETRIKRVLIG